MLHSSSPTMPNQEFEVLDPAGITSVDDKTKVVTIVSDPSFRGVRRHWWRFSRVGLVGLLAMVAVLICSGTALADSASISVTNTAKESDPAAEVPRIFKVSVETKTKENVYIKYRLPGGEPCAATANEDRGSWFENYGAYYEVPSVEGNHEFENANTWRTPGTYVFCIWLAKSGNEVVQTPITQTITFRSPRGTITGTVDPATPRPGEKATITVTGDSEASEHVYARVHMAGSTGCAPTYQSESGENLIEGSSVNGSFSVQATTAQSKAGQYVICLWLAPSGSDTTPIAGPQPETFTVVSPPPPCVVPQLASGYSLGSVEQKIRAAGCTVGSISSVASTKVARGGVLSINPAPGTKLSAGAAVNIVESAGRPCVIPVVKSGSTLVHVEHQLAAADCTASISHLHSRHVRRGRVIGLAARPHARLSPRATVRVLVSAGRSHKQ
jgi:hypothetical protein